MKLELYKKILKISYELQLAHIGSCISVVPILLEIYNKKQPQDLVIMDNAHAHLAHLVIKMDNIQIGDEILIEDNNKLASIENIIKNYGIHCDRKAGCDASGGSLGHGLGISIGYALAYPSKTVYCIVSDGGMQEGSNWEALRIKKDLKLDNLKIYVNCNGFIATKKIDKNDLKQRMMQFDADIQFKETDFYGIKALNGVNAHYKVLNKEEYEQSIRDVEYKDFMEDSGV